MAKSKNLELRQKILFTAYTMFYDKGVEPVLMKDIAAGCDISVSLLHHYFPCKEDILVHIFYDMIYKVSAFVLNDLKETILVPKEAGVAYIHIFYRLFYNILQRNNNKLLRIYTKVLYDTELLQSATDHTFSSAIGYSELQLSSEELLGVYILNGGMAQIVSLYLSNNNAIHFSLDDQLERQIQLLYYSSGFHRKQRADVCEAVGNVLTTEVYDKCYKNYIDSVANGFALDW